MDKYFGKKTKNGHVLGENSTKKLVAGKYFGKYSQKIGCWTNIWEKFLNNWLLDNLF